MLDGLLIGFVVLGALACPVMMLLGRRGIGPGCAFMRCRPRGEAESIESLRTRERELSTRIAELEEARSEPQRVSNART